MPTYSVLFHRAGRCAGPLACLVLAAPLVLGFATVGAAQQATGAGSAPGAPVLLLPDETGAFPDPNGMGGAANPPLGPARVVRPAPGDPSSATGAPGQAGDHLTAPDTPPAPGMGSDGGSADSGASPSSARMTEGSMRSADAETLAKARAAVAEATATVRELRSDSGFKKELNDLLGRARAVAVVPSFFRAGFVVGAAYGTTLLMVRDDSGALSQPAFLTMTAGSLGFQAGAQDARMILLIMTDAGLRAMLKDGVKLEAGASITFGLFGGGVSTGSTTDINQDIVALSHSRGLFGGGALEGAVVKPRADWNAIYYDTPGISAETIVFERPVANTASRPLIEAVQAPSPGDG